MWLDEGLVAEIIAFHQHANKKNNVTTKIIVIQKLVSLKLKLQTAMVIIYK